MKFNQECVVFFTRTRGGKRGGKKKHAEKITETGSYDTCNEILWESTAFNNIINAANCIRDANSAQLWQFIVDFKGSQCR